MRTRVMVCGFVPTLIISAFYCCLYQPQMHFVWNSTESMPKGLYLVRNSIPKIGDIVGVCIPDSYSLIARQRGYVQGGGECEDGNTPLMKYVYAVEGESVEITQSEVLINGVTIPNTGSKKFDSQGRSVKSEVGSYVLAKGELMVLSTARLESFDSRYFGPVSEVIGVAIPLITPGLFCRVSFEAFDWCE